MTTVSELTKTRYTKVGVFRNAFPVARYFFDIHVGDEGFAGLYMWKRNDFRFPIYHHLTDLLKRNGRSSQKIDDLVADDDRHFFVKYDEIQGVVTDRDHKQIEVLTVAEEMRVIFRPYGDYDEFVATLKEKIPDRFFTRDNIDITDSAYV